MGIFHHDSGDGKNETCPVHSLHQDAKENIVGDFTFYQLSMIIAGACTGVTILIMFTLKQLHATHLSNPSEQVKIMRIGTLISMFGVISLLSISFPSAAVYIKPWLHAYEGFALGSFFLLLCDYVSPHRDQRDVFFATKRKNGMKWFKTRWVMIFQMPVVAIITSVATDVTEAAGVFCQYSNKPRYAKIWLQVIMSLSLVASVAAILQMYGLLKKDLAHHRPFLKLTAFKIVVGLTFIQEIIFSILSDQGVLKPTDTLTYADVHIGIPNLLICIEMVPLALFFCFAYPWKVYKDGYGRGNFAKLEEAARPSSSYQGGPFGIYAWLAMLNPSDSWKAIIFAITPNRSESPGTPVAVSNYNSDDGLISHPYNAQAYSMPPQGPRDGYSNNS
ncbi:hypothetical protein NW762_009260 [Fusarium torreyae]|uniref:DUF300-domain-containing protein n=1 Tax=Fusarium torreyae TaxID=1237075 RepID=A0A9W8RU83_9HYPO|nr:hypothetical protein NW762_009260 [Fusarium torreyae]